MPPRRRPRRARSGAPRGGTARTGFGSGRACRAGRSPPRTAAPRSRRTRGSSVSTASIRPLRATTAPGGAVAAPPRRSGLLTELDAVPAPVHAVVLDQPVAYLHHLDDVHLHAAVGLPGDSPGHPRAVRQEAHAEAPTLRRFVGVPW